MQRLGSCRLWRMDVWLLQQGASRTFLGGKEGLVVERSWCVESDKPVFQSIVCYFIYLFTYLLIFIECIGVTLVNKIVQVSRVQFYNTSSVYCIVHSPPQVKSPSITIDPPLPFPASSHPHFPLVITILLSAWRCFFVCFQFCLTPSPFSPSPPIPFHSDSCQSVLCYFLNQSQPQVKKSKQN